MQKRIVTVTKQRQLCEKQLIGWILLKIYKYDVTVETAYAVRNI